jgi:hypothetical protein
MEARKIWMGWSPDGYGGGSRDAIVAVAARGHAREGRLVAPTAHSSLPILHYIVQCIILHL